MNKEHSIHPVERINMHSSMTLLENILTRTFYWVNFLILSKNRTTNLYTMWWKWKVGRWVKNCILKHFTIMGSTLPACCDKGEPHVKIAFTWNILWSISFTITICLLLISWDFPLNICSINCTNTILSKGKHKYYQL